VANFIVEHMGSSDVDVDLVEVQPWSLFFDRSVCSRGQGVVCVLVSPNGESFVLAIRLEFLVQTIMSNTRLYYMA
jgi:hypothetical protein